MYATPRRSGAQQKLIASHRSTSHCQSVFNLLTSDLLFDQLEAHLPNHRERLFPPTETLSMFIAQAMNTDRSCQHIVNQASMQRLIGGLPVCSTHTGGYCRARQRLPLALITGLSRHLGRQIAHQAPPQWRWKGRYVRLVDGTTVTMPDTVANQAAYPQQRGQKAGLGFPISRVVGISCLSSGALLNAAIGRFNGKGGDEQTLLRSIQETFQAGDIVLADAFFATYFFIASMQAKGVDILMEQHGARRRTTDFRRGRKLGQRDHLIVIDKPKNKPYWMSEEAYRSAPPSLLLRELRAGGKILVTTMTCVKTASKAELKSLYRQRWGVELDLRDIKETMGMNILSCKTPEMVAKEIWVYLLAYNLIRLLMLQSAVRAGIKTREISFKHTLQLWLHWSRMHHLLDASQLTTLWILIAQQRVGQRPGRTEPRAVKRRPKAYPLLTKPRELARLDVQKHGHPKKLK